MRPSPFSVTLLGAILVLPFPTRACADPARANHAGSQEQFALLTRMQIKGDAGKVLGLLSPEAYRAEFRHLRRKFHEIDLKGPAVETDGWTHNIPEAEWPFMEAAYLGYAACNLAQNDPSFREEALAEARWLIEAMQTPRLSGFIAPHFGPPFGNEINPSTFVHGHFLSLAVRYREASGDSRYDAVIHRVASALAREFGKSDQAILRSYKDMWWVTDNCPSLSALTRYGRLFQRDPSKHTTRFVESIRQFYLDKDTGLFCTYLDPTEGRQLQGPRGISVMYGLHFLRDIDPDFASEQWALARRHLVRTAVGLAAVREFPEGASGEGDVDSGPVLFGLGPSASGFAVAAAAVMDDRETVEQLLRASVLAGAPVYAGGELRYTMMPTVGQTVILFGKTTLRGSNKAIPR